MYDHYFSNFGRPPVSDDICKGSTIRHPRFWRRRCLKVFPIQMHREANLTLPKKCQYTTFILAILVDLPSPMTDAKIQSQGILGSGRRFLNVFTIYGHGGHLGQWTATILAIFRSTNLRRLHMKFEQNWQRTFRGEVV